MSDRPAAAQMVIDSVGAREVTALEGDRISIDGERISLFGIDAPDRGQRCVSGRGREYDCFEAARQVLNQALGAGAVTCEVVVGSNRDGRVARCRIEGRDLSGHMVAMGWAMAYRSLTTQYVTQERVAMAARRGLWHGRAEAPWLYRDRMTASRGKSVTMSGN